MAKEDNGARQRVTIHLQKGAHYRDIYVDGVFGGPTPHQLVHMAMYSERFPIPRSIAHAVADKSPNPAVADSVDIKLGEELEREVKEGIVRELQVGAIMKPETALSLGKWLISQALATGADPAVVGLVVEQNPKTKKGSQ